MMQYKMFEMSFACNDPFGEVTAAFTDESGVTTTVRGFAAGDDIVKIRFYPSSCGTYTYEISGEVRASGSVVCVPAENGAGAHGIVRACGTHFRYDDGTWFYPFGTTVYALTHQEQELVDRTMETLSKSPFNKVRMCVFPKHYDYNHNEPELFPFEKNENEKFNVGRPCFRFFDEFERRIKELDNMGIQCDLILFHPYDRWGFADMEMDEAKIYLDYLIRRLSAFPNVWWSLANEFDLMKYTQKEWEEIAEFVGGHDVFHHLLSNHNCIEFWDFDNRDTTHICLQIKSCDEVSGFIRKYGKPLMVDECCYEGNIAYEWGNLSAFEMVNRFWIAVVQGGYCTHGETYLSDDDILWWSRGGILKGESAERISFLKDIIDLLPGPVTYCGFEFTKERYVEINENPGKAENDFWRAVASVPWDRAKDAMLNGKEYAGCVGDKAYIKYLERKCAAVTDFNLSEEHSYDVELIDVWNMTRKTVLTGVSGKIKVKLPGREGTALLALCRE